MTFADTLHTIMENFKPPSPQNVSEPQKLQKRFEAVLGSSFFETADQYLPPAPMYKINLLTEVTPIYVHLEGTSYLGYRAGDPIKTARTWLCRIDEIVYPTVVNPVEAGVYVLFDASRRTIVAHSHSLLIGFAVSLTHITPIPITPISRL